jgi:hypothetical protein
MFCASKWQLNRFDRVLVPWISIKRRFSCQHEPKQKLLEVDDQGWNVLKNAHQGGQWVVGHYDGRGNFHRKYPSHV